MLVERCRRHLRVVGKLFNPVAKVRTRAELALRAQQTHATFDQAPSPARTPPAGTSCKDVRTAKPTRDFVGLVGRFADRTFVATIRRGICRSRSIAVTVAATRAHAAAVRNPLGCGRQYMLA